MKNFSKYRIIAIGNAGAFFLALNPLNFPEGAVFFAAAAVVILISLKKKWINGVFTALFFNFGYFSLHSAGTAAFMINTGVFSAFALLSSVLTSYSARGKKALPEIEDKELANKAINALLTAHEMLWEINKGLDSRQLMEIYAKNMMNFTGAGQVIVYLEAGENYEKVFSYGDFGESMVRGIVREETFGGCFCLNTAAEKTCIIENLKGGYFIFIPAGGDKNVKKIAALYGKEQFKYSDIYMAEFFTAQVFVMEDKQKLIGKLRNNYGKITEALALAIDIKDHETHGHSLDTMEYAVKIAEKMGLPEKDKENIKYAALLHDIGKINISGSILNKPASLSKEEYDVVKKHPGEGAEILAKLEIFREIMPVVRYHHEHYNGKGYPEKLKGDDIPLGSRICAVADAYSVMRSDRPYRKAMSKEDAVNELKKCSGTQFDENIVNTFLKIIEKEENSKQLHEGLFKKSIN